MDRFKRFRAYARAWATGEIQEGTHDDNIVAAAIGARAKLAESKLMTIQELDVTIDSLGTSSDEEADDDAPDVGPSARDAREREDAAVRLRQFIAADGKTDTGGRWLFDAAADEIVRLRADLESAWSGARERAARLDEIRDYLSARTSEAAQDAAARVAGELRQAKEALEQARANVDELRAMNARLDDGALALAADAQHGREQGAAEMRERAARIVDEMLDEDLAGYAVIQRGKAVDAIGALPLDGAPAEQQRGVDAAGLEFVDERAERKAARVGEYSTMFMGGRMLPGRPRRSTPEPADELSPEDADALLASGTWRKSVCGVTWIGPAGGVVDPRTSFGLRGMREAAAELRAKKAPPADTLSAEDAATLRGAGWRKLDGGWLDPHDRIWRSNPTNAAGMRQIAAELRAAKAPPVAHMGPGKATGEESATGGTGSVAEEQGATQGIASASKPCSCPGHKVTTGRPDTLSICGACLGVIPRASGELPAVDVSAVDVKRFVFSHVAAVPQTLPRPPRVEVGQRWAVDWRDITGKIDECTVEAANAAQARLRGEKGVTYMQTSEMLTSLRWTFLGPAPQDPSPKRDGEPVFVPGPIYVSGDPTPRGAYVVGPVTGGAASPESEPTARDAVAGMLLRCGFSDNARDLARGANIGAVLAGVREFFAERHQPVCIAALEALVRGGLRPTESLGLLVDIARANKARDEARAEAAALRYRAAELETIAASFICDKCGAFPSDGESVTTAEMRPAEDIAREMVSDAHQSDFSMESRATLFGILVVPALQGDVDDLRRQIAHLIERIRAEGLRASGRERVEAVDVARLRAALEAEAEEFNRYGDDAALADARAMSRGAAMVQNERDARLVLSTLGFADMAIERVLGASSAKAPNPQNIAAAFKRIGEPAPGMRIERRADGEWLVGASEDCNDCEERSSDGMICTTHFDGQHISEGESDSDGATHIEARWPIASAAGDVESSRVAIPAADDLHLFSIEPESRVDLIVPKALDPHDVLRTVAELLGIERPSAGQVQAAIELGDYASERGIEDGERRAKAKAAELVTSWEARIDAIGREVKTLDPSSDAAKARWSRVATLGGCALEIRKAFGVDPAT